MNMLKDIASAIIVPLVVAVGSLCLIGAFG